MPVSHLTTKELSLFSNSNPKKAVKGIIRGQNGIKLGRVAPWP